MSVGSSNSSVTFFLLPYSPEQSTRTYVSIIILYMQLKADRSMELAGLPLGIWIVVPYFDSASSILALPENSEDFAN